jgi:hypothetical protein
MYKTIYVPVDNSDHSNTAVDSAVGRWLRLRLQKSIGEHRASFDSARRDSGNPFVSSVFRRGLQPETNSHGHQIRQ